MENKTLRVIEKCVMSKRLSERKKYGKMLIEYAETYENALNELVNKLVYASIVIKKKNKRINELADIIKNKGD